MEPEQREEAVEEVEKPSLVQLSTQPGAKTSDFYSVKTIPERFNHPGIYNIIYNVDFFQTNYYTCIPDSESCFLSRLV